MRIRGTVTLALIGGATAVAHGQGLPRLAPVAGRGPAFFSVVGVRAVRVDARSSAVLRRNTALDVSDAPVTEALAAIEGSALVRIVYADNLIPPNVRVTVRAERLPLAAALTAVLQDVPVDVRVAPDGLLTLVGRRSESVLRDSLRTLSGVVTDSANREPIAGVNVLLDGTKVGTITGADGTYHLRVATERAALVFYRIGYLRKTVPVPAGVTLNVTLTPSAATLSAVQVTASKRQQPVEHTSDLAVVEEIKQTNSVVSGIASEQIAKSADLNAAQIVRHISGVTVTDESFLVVRGMNQRYNATYLDDNLAPSTELYSRAFDLSLIPDRIVDKILVYKSPRADLIGDMTGAAVKIFTKDALAIRRFDVSLRVGDKPISTGKDMLGYRGGSTDWLGLDDGTRRLPAVAPAYGDFTHPNLSQSQYVGAFSPVLGPETIKAAPDLQGTLSYYDNWKIVGASLYNVTSASYTSDTRFNAIYQQLGQSQPSAYGGCEYNPCSINMIQHNQRGVQKANLNLMQNVTLRLSDAHQVYFKNFVLQQGTKTTLDQIQYPNDSIRSGSASGIQGTLRRNLLLAWEQRFLYQGNVGGTHDLASNQSLAWNVGLTSSVHTIPDERTTRFQDTSFIGAGAPYLNSVEPPGNAWRAIDRSDVGAFTFQRTGTISRVWTRNTEQLYNASLDYTVSPTHWLDAKVGTYDFAKNRSFARRAYAVYDGELAAGTPGLFDLSGENAYSQPGITRWVNDNLLYFRPQDLNKVWSTTYFRNDMTGLAIVDVTNPTDAYKANENYAAGYVMATVKPLDGHVELNGGVRLESDQLRLATAIYPGGELTGTVALPLLVRRQANSWLPSVNLAWRPAPALVARLAYGKTVNRPEFRELAPVLDYNYEDNTTIYGNPTLVQAAADNYDARVELYPGRLGGALIVGAFYKSLRHPIERLISSATVWGTVPSIGDLISFGNAPRAIVKGFEAEARQHLFWGLSAAASGAVIDSRVTGHIADNAGFGTGNASNYARPRPLQGQAPYIVDAGLFYDNASIGTRIGTTYSVQGASIYAVGATRADTTPGGQRLRGSILEIPRGLLELAVTQSIGSAWRFKLSGQNLLNEAIRFAEDENYDSKYEPEQLKTVTITTNAGSFRTKQYVGDNIYRRYNPGQSLLLSITRSF